VPFVHLRDDTTKEDIKFFAQHFNTRYFNIHEDYFKFLDNWKGYWDRLYLELNYDNQIAKDVKVRQIGGFCVDFSHLKASIARGTEEAYYTFVRKNKIKFSCSHLNGYDPVKMEDKHLITDISDFKYLTTLPKYVFGDIIALEVDNSIREQIKFKKYLVKLLGDYFSNKNQGGKFKYLPDAEVFFRNPQNITEHLRKSSRFQYSEMEMNQYFGDLSKYYAVPKTIAIKAVAAEFTKKPVQTVCYLAVNLYTKINRLRPCKVLNPIWEVDLSTKNISHL